MVVEENNDELVRILEDENPPIGLWQPNISSTAIRLRDILFEDKAAADHVIAEACQILAQCTPPNANRSDRIGLVCGYVQSGKTASMTGVTALAKDNGFRIVILLAGVTTNLVTQNQERLEHMLRKASSEWAWMMLANPRPNNHQQDIQSLVNEWRNPQFEEEDRRTLFVTVMKNVIGSNTSEQDHDSKSIILG